MADKALAAKTLAVGAAQDGVAATKARAQEEGEKLSERKPPSKSVSIDQPLGRMSQLKNICGLSADSIFVFWCCPCSTMLSALQPRFEKLND